MTLDIFWYGRSPATLDRSSVVVRRVLGPLFCGQG
jgi:hypothetical protein